MVGWHMVDSIDTKKHRSRKLEYEGSVEQRCEYSHPTPHVSNWCCGKASEGLVLGGGEYQSAMRKELRS